MATFERHVDVDWKGSVTEGKGEAKAGTGAFSLPVTFPDADRRTGRQDQPRGADGRGARGLLRDGAERHARPQERVGGSDGRARDGHGRQGRRGDQDRRRRSSR